MWLKRLNDALKMFNPLFIIPLLQCNFIFFAVVSGGIFFQEFSTFDLRQWMGFWFGIIVMFSGLVLLTPKPKSTKDDELHRALVNLLLESRSVSNMERTPRSTLPTPCHSPDQNNGDAIIICLENNEADQWGGRSPRLSKENLTNVALDALEAVKDAHNTIAGNVAKHR